MKTKAPTDSATTRSRQHTRGRWSFVLAALLGTIALLGAACGGDDGGDSGGVADVDAARQRQPIARRGGGRERR